MSLCLQVWIRIRWVLCAYTNWALMVSIRGMWSGCAWGENVLVIKPAVNPSMGACGFRLRSASCLARFYNKNILSFYAQPISRIFLLRKAALLLISIIVVPSEVQSGNERRRFCRSEFVSQLSEAWMPKPSPHGWVHGVLASNLLRRERLCSSRQ